jgi:hypothetical protein
MFLGTIQLTTMVDKASTASHVATKPMTSQLAQHAEATEGIETMPKTRRTTCFGQLVCLF